MSIQDYSFTELKASDPANKRAIIVLESELEQQNLNKVLKKKRYQILGKSLESKSVIELIRKHKKSILFLDFDLAPFGSMDLLAKIKKSAPEIKIVIIAKKLEKTQVAEARNNGVCGFLAKPLSVEAVEKLLSKPSFD